tara:strand:+ start:11890 stop:12747 length:858 start_codon:yes stop_codon:yes gene_type:complete
MNIKYFINIILYISISWSIGTQALNIPRNAGSLGISGAGIAGNIDPSINPAILSNNNNYLQISIDQWLGDVKGSDAAMQWNNNFINHLSLRTWGTNELELWGDKPDDEPLGTFGSNWVSTTYTLSYAGSKKIQYGMQIGLHYSQLFTENISGITTNYGLMFQPSESFNLGAVIRNLGFENKNGLNSNLPLIFGIGSAYKVSTLNSIILGDFEYDSLQGVTLKSGFLLDTRWLNFKMGYSFNKNKTSASFGFAFKYQKWQVDCSIMAHENSVLGIPKFIDIRRYIE